MVFVLGMIGKRRRQMKREDDRSDALAAVNIAAPLFTLGTGLGLMFGMGGSVVASIHLAQGKPRI